MTQTQQQEMNVTWIDPRVLKPHPDNPREEIDPNDPFIVDLANSIGGPKGMIQPIVATPDYFILAGHRRRVASIRAGLARVPVILRETTKEELPEDFFLDENGQRQGLSPLEEARAIANLRAKMSKIQKREIGMNDLVRRLHMPHATLRQRLHILDMPERVQKLFHLCEIPVNSASQLMRLKQWPEEIEKFADRMVRRQVTLAGLDALITRRLHALQESETVDVAEPAERGVRRRYSENYDAPALTRAIVADRLTKARGSIAMFNVNLVLDQTCCSCGMIGNESLCVTCPLPKFINGLIGRSDGAMEGDGDE